MSRSDIVEFCVAKEMPESVLNVVWVDIAMDGELIETFLVFLSVIKSDAALPKVGLQRWIEFDDFVEVREGFVDFPASEQKGSAD